MVSAILRGSMKGFAACLSIVGLSYFAKIQTELFLLNEALVLRLELSPGQYCDQYRSRCGRPEAGGQVRARLLTLTLT